MRIGIDFRIAESKPCGMARYATNLLRALAKQDHRTEYLLFVNSLRDKAHLQLPPNFRWVQVPVRLFSVAEQIVLPAVLARHKLDVFHSLSFSMPLLRGCKSVMTIYDLIHLVYPQQDSGKVVFYYRTLVSACLPSVDAIVTISENSKRDIQRALRVPEEKIEVVYGASDDVFHPKDIGEAQAGARALGIEGRFVLYVGNMRKHKNIAVLLDSLSTLSSSYPDLKLVVCGEKGHSYPNLLNKIRALGLAEKVIFLEGISDEALRDLYCAAVGLVLPSYYEGFGLPPLEAMSCGTPVIVANSPALMEIAGEGACSFNASDPAALSRHLRELLDKEAVRQEFSRRSLRRAQEFTWDRAASQILVMYDRLSGTKRTLFRARSVEAHGDGRTREKNRLARFEAFDLGNIERGEVSTLRFHEPSESPKASVIIPTLDGDRNGNLSRLLQDLCRQTYDSFEVHLVKGVKPQGKAINAGAEKSEAPLLIILDDDSTVPNANTFSNLCDVVQSDARVGMAGASVVISPESNYFQQRAAKQFPRFNMPIAEKVLESDMASHGCCVIPRSLFYEIGKEKETIFRGLDPDLRERLRRAGYKTVLVPQTWVYHPLSPTFIKLMRQFYRNGIGSAHAWLVDPKTVFQTHEKADLEGFVPRRSFLYRVARFPLRLLHALVTLRVIRCAAYTSYALGFVYGLLKYSLVKKATA